MLSLRLLTVAILAFGPIPCRADLISVRDTKDRTVQIDLLAFEDDKAVFTVPGKGDREFALPLAHFDAISQEKIKMAARKLKARLPKLELDVTVGRRRKKVNFYLVRQTVTSKVTIQNTSHSLSFPSAKGRILFIGRNSKNNDIYSILRSQEFEVPQIARSGATEFEPKSFVTEYDSDNDGYGNVGGWQYDSYVVAVLDDDGRILASKTSDPSIRAALEKEPALLAKVLEFERDQRFDKSMATVDGDD